MSDLSLAKQAVDLAISSTGRVDALIINHGTLGKIQRIEDCANVEDFRETMQVNFFSAIALVLTSLSLQLRDTA